MPIPAPAVFKARYPEFAKNDDDTITLFMTEAAREKLRAYGIAPPQCSSDAHTHSPSVIKFSRQALARDVVPCPQCGSTHTTETSPFGSTACKALYRCLDCLEPFDYFKPI